jgi:microcystin-dependent protein
MHFLDTFQHSYGTGGSVTNDFAGNPNNPNSAQAKATAANVSVAKAFTGVTVDVAGGGGAHENMPPTVFVPYIVKLDD